MTSHTPDELAAIERIRVAERVAADRAQQAERILAILEGALPKGSSLYIDRTCKGIVVTLFTGENRTRCAGSSVRDALSQLTSTINMNEAG